MKPHLCLFTDSLEPSGVGEHMLLLANALREQYRISFICPPVAQGIPLLRRAATMGLRTFAMEVRDAASEQKLQRWLESWQVNIFHCHAGIAWEGHHGIYASHDASVPVILRTEHLPYLLTDAAQQRDHRRIIDLVDGLICVSKEACASFRRHGIPSHKLRAVRNGIKPRVARRDPHRMRTALGLSASARLVLTVGRMIEQKGHGHLLEAIPAVLEHVPQAHFFWVGEGPLKDELYERLVASGLESHVHLLGRRNDVHELLAASDLFVLPSLFEGLPLAVLEAMAAELPVIGTRVCGTAEAVLDGETGRLVEVGNASELAAAVLQVLEQPELAVRWGAAGRQRFEREFSAARMARETSTLYQELLLTARAKTANRYAMQTPAATRDPISNFSLR
jgi:glycosyltransferase involved in cell wall biosynthesis